METHAQHDVAEIGENIVVGLNIIYTVCRTKGFLLKSVVLEVIFWNSFLGSKTPVFT